MNEEKPRRVNLSTAARWLAVDSVKTVVKLIRKEAFTRVQDAPRGENFLFADELDAWIESVGTPEERLEKAKEFRRQRGRIVKEA